MRVLVEKQMKEKHKVELGFYKLNRATEASANEKQEKKMKRRASKKVKKASKSNTWPTIMTDK